MTKFIITIIGKNHKRIEIERKDKDEFSKEIDNIIYSAHKSQGYKVNTGFFERFGKKVSAKYHVYFFEGKKDPVLPKERISKKEDTTQTQPISSHILWRVHKYKGAGKAFKEEFKEIGGFKAPPIWAILIGVFAIITVGLIIAYKQGWINL